MMCQYAKVGLLHTNFDMTKFIKMAKETSWRKPVASLNYIETSTLWRQEHNGFSHQNPMFLNVLLNLKSMANGTVPTCLSRGR